MPILDQDDKFFLFRFSLSVQDFPDLLQRHRARYPTTPAVENLGVTLIANAFEADASTEFVKEVCRWGGYAGIGGRVLNQNNIHEIQAAFREATALCESDQIAEALSRINVLNSLGLSFASKHLRFLCPKKAVVLDSIISGELGYQGDVQGYSDLIADCQQMASRLNRAEVKNGPRDGGLWWPCDVEMSVYAKLRGL